jgi:nucleoside 2-deoxyribosyltransferase
MEINMVCPICSNAHAIESATTSNARIIDCHQCGNFTISGTAKAILNERTSFPADRWKISAWINEFKPEIILPTDMENAQKSVLPSLHHRAERMLRWLVKKYPQGNSFVLNQLQIYLQSQSNRSTMSLATGAYPLIPIGWNQNELEMHYMIEDVLTDEMNLLIRQQHKFKISPKGLLYLEGRKESVSSVGFCAMWFNKEVQSLWTDVIEPAIRAAGYEPLRIDGKQHNGKIDDEIMASIRASKFVVSDFTGSRGGVYYEAGFAHGLGLPVIFMCRESDLNDIHFDVRQYNCILWTSEKLEEAKSQLKNRILATLGQGPKHVQ